MTQPPPGGYPPPQSPPPGGYPPPEGQTPATGGQPTSPAPGGFPAPGAYPPPTDPYPGQTAPPSGASPAAPGYPGAPTGYPPPPNSGAAPGYPGAPAGYPQSAPGAPGAQGYPGAPAGYPGPPPGYPPQQAGGYPQQGAPAGYPQQGAPGGYPPQGYGGAPGYPPPSAAKPSFDASKVTITDWIVMGTGVLLLLFSFFGWANYKYCYAGYCTGSLYSYGAWNSYWWLGPLLGLAVAAVVAARLFMGQALAQIKPIFLVGAAALGALITLIAMINILASSFYSPGFSLFVSLILGLAQTYFVWLWAQNQPDTKLPKLPGPSF